VKKPVISSTARVSVSVRPGWGLPLSPSAMWQAVVWTVGERKKHKEAPTAVRLFLSATPPLCFMSWI